jgi:uncharacterized membrane protein YfcA
MPPVFQLDDLQGHAVLAVAALLAGAVNSFAGGGTILTFPVLGAILPDLPGRFVSANATSTIGLWPGSVAAAWMYRGERSDLPPWASWLVLPSVAGAIAGAALVLMLPEAWFTALVPWLILLAAVLFAYQPRLAVMVGRHTTSPPLPPGEGRPFRHMGRGRHTTSPPLPPGEGRGEGALSARATASIAAACGLQFLVSLYGGYFGAGIGILMLAVLGMLGLGDIHRLNGVKNVLAMVINGVSAAVFALGSLAGSHAVSWSHAAVMAAASVVGSLAASHLARRLPARIVRRGVALIGFALAAYYFIR